MKQKRIQSYYQPDTGEHVQFWCAPELAKFTTQLQHLSEKEIRNTPRALIIKENRHRTTYRARLPFSEAPVLIKSFRFPGLRRAFRGRVSPYATQELDHAMEARERGIPIAPPLFLIQRRQGWRVTASLIGYRFLEGSALHTYLSVKEAMPYEKRLQLMRSAGEFTALLHNRGGIHRDYHAGNLLILRDSTIVLLDLYPLSFSSHLSEKDRVEDLAHLVASLLPIVGQSGIDELLDGYGKASQFPPPPGMKRAIMTRQRALRHRHAISRAKRCMKNSSEFYQKHLKGIRIAARRSFSPETILSLLDRFTKKYHSEPQNTLKNSPESVILTLTGSEHASVCVKWYRKRGTLDQIKEKLRGGRVLRAWKGGNALIARDIPVARPCAMVRTKTGGYLIMETAEGVELDRLLSKIASLKGSYTDRIRKNIADALGRLTRALHQKGIFHADMKACNILVRLEGEIPILSLVDYDHIKIFDTIPTKYIMKNLIQLNTSIPKEITRSLRFRFLKAYLEGFPAFDSAKTLFKMVWNASRDKTIVYISDKGDIVTSWHS